MRKNVSEENGPRLVQRPKKERAEQPFYDKIIVCSTMMMNILKLLFGALLNVLRTASAGRRKRK